MYRVENGQVTVFVYPRCGVNNPVTVNLPQNHVSGDTHGIDSEPQYLNVVTPTYNNEIQGDS